MFVATKDVSAAKQVIATLLAIAMVVWTIGAYATAEAANITSVSDLMSDTSPAALSDHTITFTTESGIGIGEVITISFPSGFDLSSVTTADFGITSPDANWTEGISGQDITFTRTVSPVAPSTVITVDIDGSNKIVSPTPANGNESFEISISAGTDHGYTRVVILDTVLVTAQVLTTFDFTVYGLATSTDINGEATTGTSGSTTLPYYVLAADTPEVLGQDLTVATNAANGFTVTVQSDGLFRSSTGAVIDDFADGQIAAPAVWAVPGDDINDRTTWGHWGITSEDDNLSGGDVFINNLWTGVSSSSPTEVFYHDGPADGFTPNIGSTSVAYKVEITPLQEAGDDYNTTLTYVATPVF